MSLEKKLFLLDAYALIFRAYYAFINRPIKNSKGLNTSAIYGFVNTLDEILRKENPSHIAVAFDPPSPTFRHDMFPAYKANRLATPEEIKLSVPYIKKILDAYHIPILEFTGFEADDVIGTVAKKAHQQGFKVYMVTPDKDYAQLVDDGIFMFKPRKSGDENEIWGIAEVNSNFEITDPNQVIDILALWGDASDNIPGAPGIGEKTAKKLIAQFGSVENLLTNTDKLSGKQKENIENNLEQIKLSKKLVTIDLDVPINFKVDEFSIKTPDKQLLKQYFEELEFRTFLKRIVGETPVNQLYKQGSLFDLPFSNETPVENLIFETFDGGKVKYSIVQSESELETLIELISKQIEFCFDTETTGLDVINDEIVGLAISFKQKEAWYIPFDDNYEISRERLNKLARVFNNKLVVKIGHNIKFDMQILKRYGIEVSGPFFDTMVGHYLINPEGRHKLDIVTENLLGYKMIAIDELIGKKGADQLNMRQVPVDTVKDYACEDADLTFRIYQSLKEQIKIKGFESLSVVIEMPLVETLAYIELAGFKIDVKTLHEYEKELNNQIIVIKDEIFKLSGETFNIDSPKQLGIILFEKLKISSETKMTKTKQYSTNEEVLVKLKDEHPIIDKILEYRGLTKLQSTYVTALPKMVNKSTGKIHTSFNQTITATGRLSSIKPNLQNIPIRDESGREIRKSFVPSDADHLILSADYSQIELRIMAHLSEDPDMLLAFSNGEDIHRNTAAKIYKVKNEEVTREMRSKAKTANFGIIYGISAYGLSQRLNIPRSEAKELIDNYFINFPKVKEYMDRSISEAKTKGYVTTLFGRKRYLPEILSSNSIVRGVAERNAINSPIQGTAADIIKIAMNSIHQQTHGKYKSKMILQVHDELVFDVYKPECEDITAIVKREMENAAQLSVPLEVEIGTGSNWLDAH
jgi:DNA polymerase I